jgi:hypothetical protein
MGEEINKIMYTHTPWNISHKENEIMQFARKHIEMDITMLSEISQVQKAKHFMLLLNGGMET